MDRIPVPEAARLTGISPTTIREWAREGQIPSTKPGRDYMVLLADVQAYIAENDVRPRRKHTKQRGTDP